MAPADRIVSMYLSDFETLTWKEEGRARTVYFLLNEHGLDMYAWSDDGIGFFYYDTLTELQENH